MLTFANNDKFSPGPFNFSNKPMFVAMPRRPLVIVEPTIIAITRYHSVYYTNHQFYGDSNL